MLDNILKKVERFIPAKHRWVLGHEGFRRYFANTGWLFLGQIFFLLLSFLIGAWIARYLGPEKYGIISYVVAFTGLFSFIANLGVDGVLHRELVSHPEKRDELLGTSLRLKLWGGGLAFGFATIAAFLFGGSPYITALIILFALSFFLQAPFVLITYFYSQVKAKQAIKAQFAAAIISSILKIGLILAGGGIIGLIIIYIIDSLWQGLLLFKFYKDAGLKIRAWKFKPELARSLWRDSWPLMLSSAAAFIYLRIDQVMVGQILGEEAVGIYAVGVKLTEVFYFIPGVICGSLFPAIVNARKTSSALYYSRLKKLYLLLGFLGLVVAAPVAFLAQPFVNFVFGSAYLGATPVLQIYIWSSISLFIGAVVGQQLMAENRTRAIFILNFSAMIVNIVLNLILIPRVGLIGAAISTLIAYSTVPLLMLFLPKKTNSDLTPENLNLLNS